MISFQASTMQTTQSILKARCLISSPLEPVLASKNALWQQDGPEILLGENDTLPMVSYMEAAQPLGEQWTYNNFGYDILANVIAYASG